MLLLTTRFFLNLLVSSLLKNYNHYHHFPRIGLCLAYYCCYYYYDDDYYDCYYHYCYYCYYCCYYYCRSS